ncbi:hypothetical protein F383_05070 [Gossypium arboreum]|uniref:Uncharacterized protein n=1 Tax=Gossypium arboreum TaxID=29729 RepID=A0A0B0PQG6_GOSAR|nr:hypothetical protein F383_05070 [Gossypium arboreum]
MWNCESIDSVSKSEKRHTNHRNSWDTYVMT